MSIRVKDVYKAYGQYTVLSGVSFEVQDGEKVALIGRNGAGKTTILKVIRGETLPDKGQCLLKDGARIGYLSQQDHWKPEVALKEQMQRASGELLRHFEITEELLGRPSALLSGGQKIRAALAEALAGDPEVLLLDEPTNHLDLQAISWLESVIPQYHGTVLIVSHDRLFLDRVASRVLEIEDGIVRSYAGNYSAFRQQKNGLVARAEADYRAYTHLKEHLEKAIREKTGWAQSANSSRQTPDTPVGADVFYRGKATAMMRQVKNMKKRIERARVEKPREVARMRLGFELLETTGRTAFLAKDLGFSYDGVKWVFHGMSFFVRRGDRLAIIGPNGSGKTTLLKLLLGQLECGQGSLWRSPAPTAYLAQEMEVLDPDGTVLDEALHNSNIKSADARSLLGCLLFTGDDVSKRVRVLSWGEKARLALARILLAAPAIIVLDEPTNGLDLDSRQAVEDALMTFPGTLIMVSHDRYLLRRLSTCILDLGHGGSYYPGGFGQFEEAMRPTASDKQVNEQILVLETRLAVLSAQLSGSSETLSQANTEFISVSREISLLRESLKQR